MQFLFAVCRSAIRPSRCFTAAAGALVIAGGAMSAAWAETADAEPQRHFDTIVVTGSPIARRLGDTVQSLSVIGRADIQRAPVDNLADLLQFAGGVDVRQRGGRGVQADVGIRGTAFEQALILVDGVRMRDPQTGHHNMNLPLPLEHIERVEIRKGPGSAAFGPGATGGAINLITRRPEANEVGFSVQRGNYGYEALSGHVGFAGERSGHLLSAAWRSADGHIADEPTDFDIRSVHYSGSWDLGEHRLRVGLGANERDFGAYKFYVDRFPDQREETRTLLAHATAEIAVGDWTLSPSLFWRRNEDWFRTRSPLFAADSINEHETDVLGGQFGAERSWQAGVTAVGFSHADERIESSALGNHDRREHSLWLEHQAPIGERLTLSLSGAAVRYSDHDDVFLPGAALSYRLRSDTTLFASAARSVRIPSYTELFLPGGAGNRGTSTLEAERSDLVETGVRFEGARQSLSVAAFYRSTRDLIDWSRASVDEDFVAANFDNHRTLGTEVEYQFRPDIRYLSALRLSYTHLHTRLDAGDRQVVYALDHPRHELTTTLAFEWLPELSQTVQVRYADRRGGETALLLASRLAWQVGELEFSLEGNNLLDKTFVEAGFAPQPGRWLVAGVALRL